ncbi:MAG: 30S ribosomal protein S17 [Planctomycetota bacterium]
MPKRSPRRVGIVESDARDKTRKVAIRFSVRHPKYGKYIRRRTTLQVHDADNVSKVGDQVEVAECRPLSKTKSWVLLRVLKSAHEPIVVATTAEEPQDQ